MRLFLFSSVFKEISSELIYKFYY